MKKILFFFMVMATVGMQAQGLEPGDYYIKNVATGMYLNGANSWGTKASLTVGGQLMTIASVGEGKYTIDSHISNGSNNHFVGASDNTNMCAEKWNCNYDVNQTLAGMPAGQYTLKVQGFYRAGNGGNVDDIKNAVIYANGNELGMRTLGSQENCAAGNDYNGVTLPNSMAQASACFSAGQYENTLEFTLAEAGDLTIGVKKSELIGGDWSIFDNFRQSYLGAAPAELELGTEYSEDYSSCVITVPEPAEGHVMIYTLDGEDEDAEWQLVEGPITVAYTEGRVEAGVCKFVVVVKEVEMTEEGAILATYAQGVEEVSLVAPKVVLELNIAYNEDNSSAVVTAQHTQEGTSFVISIDGGEEFMELPEEGYTVAWLEAKADEQGICIYNIVVKEVIWDENYEMTEVSTAEEQIHLSKPLPVIEYEVAYSEDNSSAVVTAQPTEEGTMMVISIDGGEEFMELPEEGYTVAWLESLADENGICVYNIVIREYKVIVEVDPETGEEETYMEIVAEKAEQIHLAKPLDEFPAAGVAYEVRNVDAGLNLTVGEADVTINHGSWVYFTEVEGGYAISNQDGWYIKKGGNNWTLTATQNIDEAYTISLEEVEGGYKLNEAVASFGIDDTAAGSKVYGDKKTADKHLVWTITAAVPGRYIVVANAAKGGVVYGGESYENGDVLSADDLTVEDLTAVEAEGYNESEITINGSAIIVTYGRSVNIAEGNIVIVGAKANEVVTTTDLNANDHWYVITQTRNGESPMYDSETTPVKRAAASVTPASLTGMDAAEAAKYMVRFFATETEGVYNMQFATGNYIAADLGSGANAGNYVFYQIAAEGNDGTHYAWNLNDKSGKRVDNNGAGGTVAFWGNGEVTSLNGNNDWAVYEVSLAIPVGNSEENPVVLTDGWNQIAAAKVAKDEANATHFSFTAEHAGLFVFACNPGTIADCTLPELSEEEYMGMGTGYGKVVAKGDVITFTAVLPASYEGVAYDNEGNEIEGETATYTINEYYITAEVQPLPVVVPEQPVPAFSELVADNETIYYLYNVDKSAFVMGANEWGTRVSLSAERGNQFKIEDNGEGKYSLHDLHNGNWNALDCGGASGMWVDGKGRSNWQNWTITALEGNTYQIGNTGVAGLFGTNKDLASDSRVYMVENGATTWAFISEADYAAYWEAAADYIAYQKVEAAKEHVYAMNTELNGTNVYTAEAKAAFDAKFPIEAWKEAADYNTLTDADIEAINNCYNANFKSTGWHAANDIDDLLTSAWEGADGNFGGKYYINTWSTEGENDGTMFKVPFFEYWVGDGDRLGNNIMTATVTGLTPGANYAVSSWTRARLTNGVEAPVEGISFKVGDGKAVAFEGDQVNEGQFYIGMFMANGKADAEGNLTISYIVEDANVSWLSWKNVYFYETPATIEADVEYNEGGTMATITTDYVPAEGNIIVAYVNYDFEEPYGMVENGQIVVAPTDADFVHGAAHLVVILRELDSNFEVKAEGYVELDFAREVPAMAGDSDEDPIILATGWNEAIAKDDCGTDDMGYTHFRYEAETDGTFIFSCGYPTTFGDEDGMAEVESTLVRCAYGKAVKAGDVVTFSAYLPGAWWNEDTEEMVIIEELTFYANVEAAGELAGTEANPYEITTEGLTITVADAPADAEGYTYFYFTAPETCKVTFNFGGVTYETLTEGEWQVAGFVMGGTKVQEGETVFMRAKLAEKETVTITATTAAVPADLAYTTEYSDDYSEVTINVESNPAGAPMFLYSINGGEDQMMQGAFVLTLKYDKDLDIEMNGVETGALTYTIAVKQANYNMFDPTVIEVTVQKPAAPAVEDCDLVAEMFKVWDNFTADAVETNETAYGEFHFGEEVAGGGTVYGNGSVLGSNYANLSNYAILALTVESGTPRLLFNRQSMDGSSSNFLEVNSTESPYVKVVDGVWYIDLAKIVADKGFAHLNVIKANWGVPVNITEAKLLVEAPDAISTIATTVENGAIYDMAGRRVSKTQKGQIYIINGKKVRF